jgi:hypothetical protein
VKSTEELYAVFSNHLLKSLFLTRFTTFLKRRKGLTHILGTGRTLSRATKLN